MLVYRNPAMMAKIVDSKGEELRAVRPGRWVLAWAKGAAVKHATENHSSQTCYLDLPQPVAQCWREGSTSTQI